MPHSTQILSDVDLLARVKEAARDERRSTVTLVTLLAEVDERRLYLGEGYPSLFAYCTGVLRLSEQAAYARIAAARASRRFPVLLDRLAEGAITLTTIGLIAPHLTRDNIDALVEACIHKSKLQVLQLLACLFPQPDVPSVVRPLPAQADGPPPGHDAGESTADQLRAGPDSAELVNLGAPSQPLDLSQSLDHARRQAAAHPSVTPTRPVVAPLAADRYLVKVTIGAGAYDLLTRAQDLLRCSIPHVDPAAVIERALAVLVEDLERRRFAATRSPRPLHRPVVRSRHIPADVRRAVWRRDGGRCAFIGTSGRCTATTLLEFHHVLPYADQGMTNLDNLSLRCRAHNGYEAERWAADDRRVEEEQVNSV